jgi:hypothetical protein
MDELEVDGDKVHHDEQRRDVGGRPDDEQQLCPRLEEMAWK